MTLITRITRLRVPGVFRAFTWPTGLPDFGRYNLIYGWNGTGKTSLSRVLRALELQKPLPADHAVIHIGPNDIRSEDFASVTTTIRVFNRDFINEAVFPSGGGDVPPIFVVGKEAADKQKAVDELKRNRQRLEAALNEARSSRQEAQRALDTFCIDRAKLIKEALRSSGPNSYNNYDKSDYRTRAQRMVADGDAATHRLNQAERDMLLTQLRASPKPRTPLLSYQIPALQQIADGVSQLLSTTVVSRAIQELKDDPALSQWIHQGLGLHRERSGELCLFCEQSLPRRRLQALEAHFSAEYESFMRTLDAKIEELRGASEQAAGLKTANKAEVYDDLSAEYEAAERSLRETLDVVRGFIAALTQELEQKKARPFDRMPQPMTIPPLDIRVVDKVNAVIAKHNQVCEEFELRITEARNRLAFDMIAEPLSDFVQLTNVVTQTSSDVDAAQQEVQHLTGEITRLEREIVEYRRPAEELNGDLRKYLGHDELKLEIRDTGYAITRNGVPAQALSEGETTAIALLYFLKSLEDRRLDLKKGIVVLDDPVSSLDANALYLAFGFIRERTQDAGQLFIFTHNFTLFRQVRNWFHHLKRKAKKDACFYMLYCGHDGGQRSSMIAPLDPLLRQYESEYHYLFLVSIGRHTPIPPQP